MESEIKILKDFVEGNISAEDFEKCLFENPNFAELLSDETLNLRQTYIGNSTIFLYLAELKIQSISGRLNAQGAVQLFLTKKEIGFNKFTKYSDDYGLILDSQPKYIDANLAFIEKYILPNDLTKSKTELKKEIKEKYLHLFKYQTKPPKWIQSPNWIIKNDKPLFFLGQFEIKNCDIFHDDGAVYLFVNDETGDIETVKQFY
ncbi:hypothetical protein [Flavobacterium humidisoli]|uniref:DUF3298 domain-containing protein n=1 Tax=Flavobacterium humidisoli TaxID=2937442 RepID=A0ABY4LVU2_9FLAO|nr:hypothetical protein [Flavobacterium humidisoli]UPZ16942.1 hypothetical protein M0M44_06250 [Flavobacterium humidisoli]